MSLVLLQPWLAKSPGLSKQGLEQAAHTFGIIRSVNLIGGLLEIAIDSIAMGSFLSFQ